MILAPLAVMGQNGTNSPYSQYGLGVLSDANTGYNRGMNGLGVAMHEHNQVNYANPASYSNMDSLTFIIDLGATLQGTHFKEGNTTKNAYNANFDYLVMGFRAFRNLGVTIGFVPYSSVGYNYYTNEKVSSENTTTYTTTYNGSGGVRNLFIGAGWMPVKGLSIGANFGFMWGNIDRSVVNSYSDTYVNTLGRYYSMDITSYRLDLGLQYTLKLGRLNSVTVGATYTPGHTFGGSADLKEITTNSQTSVADTTTYSNNKALFLPTSFGAGIAWYHTNRWRIGADFTMQKWGEKQFPDISNGKYQLVSNVLMDRKKFTLGGEYVNNPLSRKYLNRVHIKAGVSYATPYIKVNGVDGPRELAATVGFSLPITNVYNNRSFFNISAQWVNNSAKNMINENIFRINLGVTFNERWFMKWKVN